LADAFASPAAAERTVQRGSLEATPLFGATGAAHRRLELRDVPLARAERQHQALERARLGETLTVRGHAATHGIDPSTASTDLWGLEREGLLLAEGRGRSLLFRVRC
jgi:hypothetical protein